MSRYAIVTGAAGAIGRSVVREFTGRGWQVAGLGHGAQPGELGLCDWINGEINGSNLATLAAGHGRPEAIVHLAGGSAVAPSFSAPGEDFARTVSTGVRLLEWVRQSAPETAVVLASSAAVYGSGHQGPINENAPRTPYSPYGFHKAMMEMAGESWAKNFGIRVAIVRLFSVYGSGLRKQLVWEICSRLSRGENEIVLGGVGSETRDWLNIKDAASILVDAIGVASPKPGIYNGCTGTALSIADTAERLILGSGAPAHVRFTGERRAGDPQHLIGDCNQARALGLSAVIAPDEGLVRLGAELRGRLNA